MSIRKEEAGYDTQSDENPYLHFIISEFWAGLTAVIVYGIFHGGAYVIQIVNERFPLTVDEPSSFLDLTLSWCAALSAAVTFVVITLFQVIRLSRRLWRDLDK